MRVSRPVYTNQYPIGSVMIEADLSRVWLEILKSMGVIGVAASASLLVAQALAARFKGAIAAPVTELINAARSVSARQNYSLRIPHCRNDELGTLIDSFNAMLALAGMCKQIEQPEQPGRGGSTVGAEQILLTMEQLFDAVRRALSAILEKET